MDKIAAFIPLVEIGAKRDWHGLWPNWCISEPFFLFFLWQCGNFRFTIRHSHLLAAISDISWFTSDSRSHPNFLLVTSPWPMMVCSVLIYHHFQASRCLKSFRTQFGRDRDSHFHSGHRWILRLGILRLLFQVPCCAQGVLVRKTRRMTSKNQSYLKEVIYIYDIYDIYICLSFHHHFNMSITEVFYRWIIFSMAHGTLIDRPTARQVVNAQDYVYEKVTAGGYVCSASYNETWRWSPVIHEIHEITFSLCIIFF